MRLIEPHFGGILFDICYSSFKKCIWKYHRKNIGHCVQTPLILHRMSSICLGEVSCSKVQRKRPGDRFGNVCRLLNLRALKLLLLNRIHIFQCTGKIFCVEFPSLQFHQTILHIHWKIYFSYKIYIWELSYLRAWANPIVEIRRSYDHNGISFTGKMTCLYWIGALYALFKLSLVTQGFCAFCASGMDDTAAV